MIWLPCPRVTAGAEQCNYCRHSEASQFYTRQVYSTSNRCRHSEALQFYIRQVYSTSNHCRHSEAFTVLYTSGVQYFCQPCDCHHWRWGVINWVISFIQRELRPLNSSSGLRRKACSSLKDETTLSLDMSFVWMGHHTSRHPTSPATSPNSWYVLYWSTPSYINTPNLTGHQSKLLALAEEDTQIHFKFFLQHSATVATSQFLSVGPSRLVSQSKLHLVRQCRCSPGQDSTPWRSVVMDGRAWYQGVAVPWVPCLCGFLCHHHPKHPRSAPTHHQPNG